MKKIILINLKVKTIKQRIIKCKKIIKTIRRIQIIIIKNNF